MQRLSETMTPLLVIHSRGEISASHVEVAVMRPLRRPSQRNTDVVLRRMSSFLRSLRRCWLK